MLSYPRPEDQEQAAILQPAMHAHLAPQTTYRNVITEIDGGNNTITHQRNISFDNRVVLPPQVSVDNRITVHIHQHRASGSQERELESNRPTVTQRGNIRGDRENIRRASRERETRPHGEGKNTRPTRREHDNAPLGDRNRSHERANFQSSHNGALLTGSPKRGCKEWRRDANLASDLERPLIPSFHRDNIIPVCEDAGSTETERVGIHLAVGEPYQPQRTISERFSSTLKKFGKVINERVAREQDFQLPTPILPIPQFSDVSDAGKTASVDQNLLEHLRLHISSKSDPLDQMHFCAMWKCSTRNYDEEHGLPLPKPSDIFIGDVGFLSPAGVFQLHASVWEADRGGIKLSSSLVVTREISQMVERERINEGIEMTYNLDVKREAKGEPEVIVFDRYPGDLQRFFLDTEGPLVRQCFSNTQLVQEFVSNHGAQIYQEIDANLSLLEKVEGPLVLITSTTRAKSRVVRFMMFPLPKPFFRKLYKMRSDSNLSEYRPPYDLKVLRRSSSFQQGKAARDYIGASIRYADPPKDVVFIQGLPISPPTASEPTK